MLRSTLLTLGFLASASAIALACSDDDPAAPNNAAMPDGGGQTPPPNTPPPAGGDGGGGGGGLESGDGYSIVYSAEEVDDANIGIDARPGSSATFAAGRLIGYAASEAERLEIGAATQLGAGGDATFAWGTWQGGPTTGKFFANESGAITFPPPSKGFHYAIGKDGPVPTGKAAYALVGASSPTTGTAAAPGSVTATSAQCDFDAMPAATCEVTLTVSLGGQSIPGVATATVVGAAKKQLRASGDFALAGLFVEGGGLVYAYVLRSGDSFLHGAAALKKN